MIKYESTTEDEARVGLRFNYRPGVSRDAPLVVLVHGRAGNRGVMWTFERSIPGECHVVAFEAFLHDPIGGWSWWDMAVPGSKREAIHHAAERFQRALRAFIDFYGLDPRVLVGAGFSQGSVLLSAVTLLQIVPFDGLAILAGYVYRPSEAESLNQNITVNHPTVNHKPTVFVAHEH